MVFEKPLKPSAKGISGPVSFVIPFISTSNCVFYTLLLYSTCLQAHHVADLRDLAESFALKTFKTFIEGIQNNNKEKHSTYKININNDTLDPISSCEKF